jgi:hypothetical protein
LVATASDGTIAVGSELPFNLGDACNSTGAGESAVVSCRMETDGSFDSLAGHMLETSIAPQVEMVPARLTTSCATDQYTSIAQDGSQSCVDWNTAWSRLGDYN